MHISIGAGLRDIGTSRHCIGRGADHADVCDCVARAGAAGGRGARGNCGGEAFGGCAAAHARHRRAYGADQKPRLHARGRQLVSGSHDKTIRVWDLVTGKTVRRIYGEAAPGQVGMIYAIALSPDGKWLAAGGESVIAKSTSRIYASTSSPGASSRRYSRAVGYVETLAFSPDGRYLISGSGNSTAIIWDVAPRNCYTSSRAIRPKSTQ